MSDLGIDRFAVSFPVSDFDRDPTVWGSVTVEGPGTPGESERRSGKVPVVEGCSAFVGVQQIAATGEWWGKVEFNPSRVVDVGGASLCPVVELPTAVAKAWRAASAVMTSACEVQAARLKRVDVARDFEGIEVPGFYIKGLGSLRRPWARRSFTYNDPTRGLAETFFVGSNAGGARLYDKHQEKPELVAPGTVRAEFEARKGWLGRYGGLRVVGDIDRDSVDAIARNRWEWSGMGMEVSATDRVIELVMRSGLSAAKQRGLLGHLLMTARGVSSGASKNQRTEYERVTRALGVVLSPELFEPGTGAGFVGRLDWDTGREVLRVA